MARQREIKKNTEELKRRADEITTLAANEAIRMENEVFNPKVSDDTVVLDEVITLGTSLADDSVVVRLIADIETMTFGYGNDYSFQAGVKYNVPRDLADHLETLGYLYVA